MRKVTFLIWIIEDDDVDAGDMETKRKKENQKEREVYIDLLKDKSLKAFKAQGPGQEAMESIKKCKIAQPTVRSHFENKFWPAYPKRVGKAAAFKAWAKLSPTQAQLDAIMDAVEKHKLTTWAGKEPQFIPHPATWLNGRRWEDEVGQAQIVAPGASQAVSGASRNHELEKIRRYREEWEAENGSGRGEGA